MVNKLNARKLGKVSKERTGTFESVLTGPRQIKMSIYPCLFTQRQLAALKLGLDDFSSTVAPNKSPTCTERHSNAFLRKKLEVIALCRLPTEQWNSTQRNR